jgi:hypothetical protein
MASRRLLHRQVSPVSHFGDKDKPVIRAVCVISADPPSPRHPKGRNIRSTKNPKAADITLMLLDETSR